MRKTDDPEAAALLGRLRSDGMEALRDIRIERVFRIESKTACPMDGIAPLLANPVSEILTRTSQLDESAGPVFEVGYQRAVTDPEVESIVRGAAALGISDVEWARIAHRYQFVGISGKRAEEIVRHGLYNPQVQVLIHPGERWTTLKPRGESGPVESVPLGGLSPNALAALSEERRLFLDGDQMSALKKIELEIGRPLTDAELEMFAQTWSDHCFHTTWKSLGLLKMLQDATLRIGHPLVLSSFEDNAGVMAFYEGWALTLKGETHNSPTAVSPYGGIMTKHGGVIRDTLGCGRGAWPIGGSTVMGLGDPHLTWEEIPPGALHPGTILVESVRGTADYCNPMGIPMMFPVYRFHPGYMGKCLALGHSVGLIPAKHAPKGRPLPGDLAILLGGPTGRDGLHGATVSSGSMTHDTATVDAAHVQIGHPIEERKFMEAVPVLRDRNCVRAITDLGAGGLSSAAGEMGADTGVWINLARVPLKTEGMRPWEIWISESQERMLLCTPPDKVSESLEILDRHEVPAVIVGRFTDDGRCRVVFHPADGLDPRSLPPHAEDGGQRVVDLAMDPLRRGCPLPRIRVEKRERKPESAPPPGPGDPGDWKAAVLRVLGHLNVCDQSAAGMQFDATVQGATAVGPYGGKDGRMPNDVWAATPIPGKPHAAVASLAFNPFYGDIDPAGLATLMIVESMTKLAVAGVELDGIVLCDNFYTPRVTPGVAGALTEMVKTCADLSVRFGAPFISGKDSSSGTFTGPDGLRIDVPPTLAVMALGRMPDIRRIITKPWRTPGNRLALAGPLSAELGGSVYLDTLGLRGNRLPDPDPDHVEATWKHLRDWQENGWIGSASAVAEGGLIRRLFEAALGSGFGCRIDLDPLLKRMGTDRPEAGLFAEMTGAVLVEAAPDHMDAIIRTGAIPLGYVTASETLEIKIGNLKLELGMAELIRAWERPFREVAR